MGALSGTPGEAVREESRQARRPPETSSLWIGLEDLYEAYCTTEASKLLELVPREGVRSLHRNARLQVQGGDGESTAWAEEGAAASLGSLREYCRRILPLPPFEVWRREYLGNRSAYLAALDRVPPPARNGEAVVVELRSVSYRGEPWTATLRIVRREGSWRGSIGFANERLGATARTAEVFREEDPFQLRERFRALEPHTLEAFLRSVLP